MTHSAGGYDCTKADGRQWLQKLGNTYGITLLSYLPLNWFLLLGWLGFVVSCFPLCVSQSMMWAIKFLNCDTYPKGISILRLGIEGAYSRFFNRKITCRWCKKRRCGSHGKISLNEPAKCFLVCVWYCCPANRAIVMPGLTAHTHRYMQHFVNSASLVYLNYKHVDFSNLLGTHAHSHKLTHRERESRWGWGRRERKRSYCQPL